MLPQNPRGGSRGSFCIAVINLLKQVIRQLGEEKYAGGITREIIRRRPLETTADLVDAIKAGMPTAARFGSGHPARKTFQALRIAVNGELDAIDAALPLASKGFLEINPDALVLSAFKRAEDADDMILRLYNPTKRLLKGNVRFFRPVKKALMTNMNEEPQKGGAIKMTGNRIHFDAPAKKIITIKLVL